jgi:hypothetical protein
MQPSRGLLVGLLSAVVSGIPANPLPPKEVSAAGLLDNTRQQIKRRRWNASD